MQIRWSRSATAALATIVRHRRERVGFMAARSLHRQIIQRVFLLKEFPELGRQMSEVPDDDRRELFVLMYRVTYRIQDDAVLIVNVADARYSGSHAEEDESSS